MEVSKGKTTTFGIDAEIDFAQLVLIQMNRCNLAMSEGQEQFITATMGFKAMLSHIIAQDKTYHKEIKQIHELFNPKLDALIKDINSCGRTPYSSVSSYEKMRRKDHSQLIYRKNIAMYEALIRLCARNNLFPKKKGEYSDK